MEEACWHRLAVWPHYENSSKVQRKNAGRNKQFTTTADDFLRHLPSSCCSDNPSACCINSPCMQLRPDIGCQALLLQTVCSRTAAGIGHRSLAEHARQQSFLLGLGCCPSICAAAKVDHNHCYIICCVPPHCHFCQPLCHFLCIRFFLEVLPRKGDHVPAAHDIPAVQAVGIAHVYAARCMMRVQCKLQ